MSVHDCEDFHSILGSAPRELISLSPQHLRFHTGEKRESGHPQRTSPAEHLDSYSFIQLPSLPLQRCRLRHCVPHKVQLDEAPEENPSWFTSPTRTCSLTSLTTQNHHLPLTVRHENNQRQRDEESGVSLLYEGHQAFPYPYQLSSHFHQISLKGNILAFLFIPPPQSSRRGAETETDNLVASLLHPPP